MTTRVEVLPPFKVAQDGQVWWPGDVAEVDDATAQHWERHGYVKPAPNPKPSRRKRSHE